jgi:DNA polymerase I-like protein with 3'-5' exonuclease and polymerase domains
MVTCRESATRRVRNISDGRGATAIAMQVKAMTGTDRPIPELEAEIAQMIQTWKTKTYTSAWKYMEECSAKASNPGYLINPWGRYRHFAETNDRGLLAAFGREAQNFPIQSTVADTCLVTLWQLVRERPLRNLHFRIVNQIHDAILLEVPEEEIEQTKTLMKETMGSIEIPLEGSPLVLDIDIDIMQRWGVK